MHIQQHLYILRIYVCIFTDFYIDYLDELILFKISDKMFLTHATASGKKLSNYNRQCQLVTLKDDYLAFYDTISNNDTKKVRDNNRTRVRNNFVYRMRVMNSLNATVDSNSPYQNMHSNEIRAYQDEAISKASQGRSQLDSLYCGNESEDMTPYVSTTNSIVFDPLSQCFVMEGDFNNYDKMDSRNMEDIIDESSRSTILINLSCNRSTNI